MESVNEKPRTGPPSAGSATNRREEVLLRIVEEYEAKLRSGETVDKAEVLARHPDLRDELES